MKYGALFGSASLVVIVGAVFYARSRQPTLEGTARTALACVDSMDANCLLDLMTDKEKRETGIDKTTMERFLREYISPTYAGLGNPDIQENANPDYGTLAYSRQWNRSSKPPATQGVVAVITPRGPRVDHLLQNLSLEAMVTKYRRPSDGQVIVARIRGIEKDGPILTSLGIKGLPQADGTLKTWKEIAAAWRAKALAHSVNPD